MIFHTHNKAYINHTDAGGIVYHANYLIFFENCRRDFLSALGFGYFIHEQAGYIHFVVKQATITYNQAIWLDDDFITSIDRLDIKPASLIFYQSIIKDGKICASASITLACVKNTNNELKPHRMPTALINACNHYQAQCNTQAI